MKYTEKKKLVGNKQKTETYATRHCCVDCPRVGKPEDIPVEV